MPLLQTFHKSKRRFNLETLQGFALEEQRREVEASGRSVQDAGLGRSQEGNDKIHLRGEVL